MTESDKRAAIIQAAMAIIANNGFHGSPIAMIAEKAGVGTGTIYRYFENKDVLINEIFREYEEMLWGSIHYSDCAGEPVRERFIYLGTTILRYFINNPTYFRFLEQYHNSPYGESKRREKILCKPGERDIFMELLAEGIERHEIKDLPFFVLGSMSFGPVIVLARDHILGLIELDDELIVKSIEACWDGIKQ